MAIRVLIVADEPEHLVSFTRALTGLCPDWELMSVNTSDQALEFLEAHTCDALIAEIRVPETTGGAKLVNEVGKKYPKILRFIMSNSLDKEVVMKCVLGSHHFLPKPCEPEILRNAVIRAITLDKWVGSEELKSLVARIRTFPSIPSLYFEVLKELRSEDASAQKVGEIIARDLAMSTKVLQVLNSAYYALPRQITDPTEAVNLLGFEMVKSLVLCIQVFTQFDKVKPNYFSIDKLWRHSTAVAQAARKIAVFEGMDAETAEEAYTAGLLHDVGKLILVSNFADQYQEAQNLARKNKIPLWDAEKIIFGATHGEIGAYLLGLWGMPLPLAEAVSFHHCPPLSENKTHGALSVVHAANALVYASKSDPNFIAPVIDEEYLARLNLHGRSALWYELLHQKPANRPKPAAPQKASTPVKVPGSGKSHRRSKSTRKFAAPTPKLSRWAVPAAVAAGLLLGGMVLWKVLLSQL